MIERITQIVTCIFACISAFYAYRTVFVLVGAFFTRKFEPAKKYHKYAILIAARNEEAVIGNLIGSIRAQDYPANLITTFVVADNCTDQTAEIAKRSGAVCYERFDLSRRTKGFALQYLVECIRQDYGINAFEGYFVFDADNLLKGDYIARMNDSFDAGEKIITSYRNTKNFDDNWIAASYGLHWLRTVRTEHRARSFMHLATRIQGTGFLFSWEVIKDGWNYTGFTEDRAFCADAVAKGYRISYNDKAEFYDEQPTSLRIALRQRIRWAKGHLQSAAESGPVLLKTILITKGAANRYEAGAVRLVKRFWNNLRLRFMSYDMLSVVLPYSLIMLCKWLCVHILYFVQEGVSREGLAALFFTSGMLTEFAGAVATAAYVFIVERKRITPVRWYKKLWYCLTFPLFDLIDKMAVCIALCSKVEWKAIPHRSAVTISDIDHQFHKPNIPV